MELRRLCNFVGQIGLVRFWKLLGKNTSIHAGPLPILRVRTSILHSFLFSEEKFLTCNQDSSANPQLLNYYPFNSKKRECI